MVGYQVRTLSRYCVEYAEGDHVMEIPTDLREPVPEFELDGVKAWKPPFEQEPVSHDKQIQILSNVGEWFRQQGYEKIFIAGHGYIGNNP